MVIQQYQLPHIRYLNFPNLKTQLIGEKLDDIGYGGDFFRYNIIVMICERNNKLDSLKLKTSTLQKQWENKPHTGRKYLQ